ncbi:MAG TPA: hypothetical protein VGK34_01230, partial [Armatimonadota bacterium]
VIIRYSKISAGTLSMPRHLHRRESNAIDPVANDRNIIKRYPIMRRHVAFAHTGIRDEPAVSTGSKHAPLYIEHGPLKEPIRRGLVVYPHRLQISFVAAYPHSHHIITKNARLRMYDIVFAAAYKHGTEDGKTQRLGTPTQGEHWNSPKFRPTRADRVVPPISVHGDFVAQVKKTLHQRERSRLHSAIPAQSFDNYCYSHEDTTNL